MKEKVYQWCKEAIAIIKEQTKVLVDTKANEHDLVTNVDRLLEEQFRTWILHDYPNHQIIGEEQGISGHESDHLWIIDPIDGTVNFVKQQKNFGILLAYYHQKQPQLGVIVDVKTENIYIAEIGKGVFKNLEPLPRLEPISLSQSLLSIDPGFASRYSKYSTLLKHTFRTRYIGACSLDSLAVIEGGFGVFVSYQGQPWDYAAVLVFARVLGLGIFDLEGHDFDPFTAKNMILCNPGATKDLRSLLYE